MKCLKTGLGVVREIASGTLESLKPDEVKEIRLHMETWQGGYPSNNKQELLLLLLLRGDDDNGERDKTNQISDW